MVASRDWQSRRIELWVGLAFIVNAIAFAATRVTHHTAVAYGAAFDVAVTVPALYYLIVVRGGAQRLATLIPIVMLALLRSTYVAPGAAVLRPFIGGATELVVIGFLVARVRRGLHAGGGGDDVVERLRLAAREIVPIAAVSSVLASELSILYYAFGVGLRPHAPKGARAFFVHEESGVRLWFGCLTAVALLEATVLHLVVSRWSTTAAWLLTVLSVYGAVWLVAMARSFALRPILLTDATLEIRSGLMATLCVPLSQIETARGISVETDGDWRLPPLCAPNVRLVFRSPIEGSAIYGRPRRVKSVALAVDDARGLLEALKGSNARGD